MVGDGYNNFRWQGDDCWVGGGKKCFHGWVFCLVTYRGESKWEGFGVTGKAGELYVGSGNRASGFRA